LGLAGVAVVVEVDVVGVGDRVEEPTVEVYIEVFELPVTALVTAALTSSAELRTSDRSRQHESRT
jgi:hypothetical protein